MRSVGIALSLATAAALCMLLGCAGLASRNATDEGRQLLRAGDYAQGEVKIRQAIDLAEQGGSDEDLADALTQLGKVMNRQGRYREAEPLMRRAVEIRERERSAGLADSLSKLAGSLEGQGRYQEAQDLHIRSMDLYKEMRGEGHPSVASSLGNLGMNFFAQGDYEQAKILLLQSLSIDGQSKENLSITTNNLAIIYVNEGNPKAALPLYRRSLELIEQVHGPDSGEVMNALDNLGSVQAELGDTAEALALERRAAGIYAARMARATRSEYASSGQEPRLRWYVPTAFGQVAWQRSKEHPEEEAQLLDESFQLVQRAQASDVAAATASVAARFAAGDDALARKVRERQDAAERLVRLDRELLEATASGEAPSQEKRAGRRMLAAELDRADRDMAAAFPEFAALVSPDPVPVGEVQQLLGPRDALLLYAIPSAQKNWFHQQPNRLWLIRKDQSAWFNLAMTGTELEEMIANIRRQLDPTSAEIVFDVDLAHQLYRKLFPFDPDLLDGVEQLIVVPHGPLESIPLSVLVLHPPAPDGGHRGADFLVENFATVTLPSVSSLRALRRFAGQSQADRPFAGIGDPVFAGSGDADRRIEATRLFKEQGGVDTEALRRLPPLPETAAELRALARFMGADEESLLLGGAATEAAVKAAPLDQARVVAFATHAGIAGELAGLAEPAIVLTPPPTPTPVDDGLLTASEVAQLRLDADFVILSACNTAAPDGSPGAAGLSGLAKSFIYAGSRSLLVSHWAVLSDAAERLTTGTMAKLTADPTLGRAEALRRTQVELLQDARYSHPAAWAPFVIVGEWQSPGQPLPR